MQSCERFPNGEIRDSERPDFIVDSTIGTLGIEVTRLYWGARDGRLPRQACETIRERITNYVQQELMRSDECGVSVTVLYNRRHEFRKATARSIAEGIVRVVRSNLPARGEENRVPVGRGPSGLPAGVSELIIRRELDFDDNSCTAPEGGILPRLEPGAVERVIRDKEKLITAYRQQVDEIWLVVAIDLIQAATWWVVPRATLESRYKSSFDRAFLVWHMGEKVVELALA